MAKRNLKSAVRGSLVMFLSGVVCVSPLLTPRAKARGIADVTTCVPDPGNVSAVICTIGSVGGPSTFLGAFASSNGGAGGWVEYYSDNEGEWWVEHHANGDTQVGWGDAFGGNYITGSKISTNQEGTYSKKQRPELTGAIKKGVKRSYAAAKAAASKQTGTLTAISAPASVVGGAGSANAELTLSGSGQCMAAIIVQKDGAFVSSTGIVPITLGTKRNVQLPSSVGTYTIQVRGKDGCLDQVRSTTVKVQRQVLRLPGLGG